MLCCFLLTSCDSSEERLTIGIIPVREASEMKRGFEPLRLYLEEKLEVPVDITVTKSYVDLIDDMKNEAVDIGFYGAFSYVAAESEMELTPLVAQYGKDSGNHYKSYIITQEDSNIQSVDQLKNSKFTFVDAGSTSGFVLPYALLRSRNIDYGTFFSETYYAGSHQQVAVDVQSKIADAGAISSIEFESYVRDGKLDEDAIRIIWESEEIPISLYVARSNLDNELQQKFVEAMLAIHTEKPKVLEDFDSGIEKFIKADSKDYNSIRNIVTVLGKEYMYEYFLKGQ